MSVYPKPGPEPAQAGSCVEQGVKRFVSYNLETTAICDDKIVQTLDLIGLDGIRERLSLWVMNAREEGIKKALIDLGWTPPPEA